MTVNIGDKIKIVSMCDNLSGHRYAGKEGTVEYIDDMGQLHGTWGGLAIIPEIDKFVKVD